VLLREVFTETAAIRFEGNGYSDEWKQEAARRGLPNLPDTPASIAALADPKRTAFWRELGIFSEREIASRFNVALERYIKTVLLEAETVVEMLATQVLPAGEQQLVTTAAAMVALKTAGVKAASTEGRFAAMGEAVAEVASTLDRLRQELDAVDGIHDEPRLARRLADGVRPAMQSAREAADRLEHLVDDANWSLPKYREMLFVR
jgi:glutamine synthetase